MKNKFIYNFTGMAFALILSGVNASYSLPAKLEPVRGSANNLILAMLGIVIFLGIIYAGLFLYNKFIVSKNLTNYELRKYNLADSVDKDDAILNYVTKNKLR